MESKQKFTIIKDTIKLMIHSWFDHDIGKNGAALAYYLLFAIFPLLIFFTNMLGLLDLDIIAITKVRRRFLPKDVVSILTGYLEYLDRSSTRGMMWFSFAFSIWFPFRAVKGLMKDVRRAYGLSKPAKPISFVLRQLAYTGLLLVVIVLTLALSTFGQKVLMFIISLFPVEIAPLGQLLLTLWHYFRFLPMAICMYGALRRLYSLSLDSRPSQAETMPGTFAAMIAWLVASVGFSFYVENFSNYTLLYGTLGAVIVLLVWLYLTAVILILGAELNAALLKVRAKTDD